MPTPCGLDQEMLLGPLEVVVGELPLGGSKTLKLTRRSAEVKVYGAIVGL